MKLSQLNTRIHELEERLAELERVAGTHWMKRPDEWKGSEATERLKKELGSVRGELKELRAWLRGNWYEDDIGAGSGGGQAPARPRRVR